MNKTFLLTLIGAGIAVLFVISRYIGDDSGSSINLTDNNQNDQTGEYSHWVDFSPDSQTFKVSFPRLPQHVSETFQSEMSFYRKQYDVYAAGGIDNNVYIVEEITYPDGDFNPQTDPNYLENALTEIVSSNNKNTLVDHSETTLQGLNALKFEIDSGTKRINGIMFLQGKTLYVLTRVLSADSIRDDKGFEHFISSFNFNSNGSK